MFKDFPKMYCKKTQLWFMFLIEILLNIYINVVENHYQMNESICIQLINSKTQISVFGIDGYWKLLLLDNIHWKGHRMSTRYARSYKKGPLELTEDTEIDGYEFFPALKDVPKDNIKNVIMFRGINKSLKTALWFQYHYEGKDSRRSDLLIVFNDPNLYWFNATTIPNNVHLLSMNLYQYFWGLSKVNQTYACLYKLRLSYSFPKVVQWY